MSADEIVGSLIFKNTDASGTPNHFAGLRARAESTFGRMDLEFYAGRSRMEGGTPDMVITPSGADAQAKVGIGISSPQGQLHINTESAEATKVYVDGEFGQEKSIELRHYNASEGSGVGRNLFYLKTPANDRLDIGGFTDGSSEFKVMTLMESGSVGIGTTSPDSNVKLDLNSGTNNVALGVESTDANVFIAFKDSGTTGTFGSAAVAVGASSDNLLFRAGSAEVGRFTSAGRFGINRTSPNGLLHMQSSSGTDSAFYIQTSAATDDSVINFGDDSSSTVGKILYAHSDNSMRFNTNSSERARITSGGAFLVGKTADNTTDTGSVVGDGYIYATRSGNIPLVLNRTTSDGTITQFRKDNSTYGSISNSGTNLIISGSGTNKSGLYYGDNALFPVKNGSLSNSTIGFGSPNYRFSNLYLSGSAYLADNGKAILGSGDDLQLFHNGANSFITNDTGYMAVKTQVNNGSLFLHGDNVHLRTFQDNQPMLTAARGGAVQLYHNNSKKFETTSSGITVHSNGNETYSVTIVSSGAYTQSYNQTTSAFEDLYTSSLNKIFKTGSSPTEALRIDSSQNVMVGGTNARPAEFNHPKGISFRGDIGQIQASTDANIPFF